jgi:hypothetical protein
MEEDHKAFAGIMVVLETGALDVANDLQTCRSVVPLAMEAMVTVVRCAHCSSIQCTDDSGWI